MKKVGFLVAILLVAVASLWQERVNLLVALMPVIQEFRDPIPANQDINWEQGPDEALLPPDKRPPNIILVLTDDMGFNDISLYNGGAGDGSVLTPHIDALAKQGVRFDNGYAANAVCAPSRATIMTGRYSTRFGFEFTPFPKIGATISQWMSDLDPPELPLYFDHEALAELSPMNELGMPTTEITIAELLQEAGYHTAHIGKWHLGDSAARHPIGQGFDESLYMEGMLYMPEDHQDVVNAKREESGIERMVWASARYAASWNRTERFSPAGYLTDYYTAEAVEMIKANRNRSFFLYLAHWGIHNPLQATREDYDKFAHIEDHHLRVYSAMIHAVDRSVGKITQALEEHGLSDNTLILFTADNGGAGYIGLPDINQPFRGWKLTHFEGGMHVPFMAKWPLKIAPGSVYGAPVHHIDLFHTIAAAAGVDVPTDRKLDGIDLLPYVNGDHEGVPHETLFWRQGHQQAVLHRGWKLIKADRPDDARWLFNLAEDPTEQYNLAQTEPAKLAALEALLAAHNADQVEPLWRSVIDMPQRIDKHGEEPFDASDEYVYWPN